MKNTLDNRIYIPCLAVADMIAAFMCSLFAIYALIFPVSYTNVTLCKISWYTMTWSTSVAVSILAMIAEQRYMKICRPLEKSVFTGRELKIVVSFYVIVVLIDSPILAIAGISRVSNGNTTNEYCDRVGDDFRHGLKHDFAIVCTVIEMLTFPLLVFCISFFYFKVSSTLYNRMKVKNNRVKRFAECSLARTNVGYTEQNTVYELDADERTKRKKKKPKVFERNYEMAKEREDSNTAESIVEITEQNMTDTIKTMKKGTEIETELKKKQTTADKQDLTNKMPSFQKRKATSNIYKDTDRKQSLGGQSGSPQKSMTSPKAELKNEPTINLFFRQHRYTVLFITITIVFFVTFLPRAILLLLETIHEDFWTKYNGKILQLLIFLNRLHIVNSVVNPLLYGIFDEKFKSEFMKIVRCGMKWRNNSISPNT